MKKLVFVILIAFVSLSFWVAEPLANNPFHQSAYPKVTTSGGLRCTPDPIGFKDDISSALEKYTESGDLLGASVGVFREGCGLFVASAGYRNKRQLEQFLPNTINRVASITKPMTAIAIMQLYEKGVLDLDTPVSEYIPDFPISWPAITTRHILSHTSGIPHYQSTLDALSFSRYESLESVVKVIFDKTLAGAPGEQYIYSSFGYTVLGRLIEVVSGESFAEYLKKHIWQQAGMQNTSLESSFSLSNKSRLYVKLGTFYLRAPYTDLSIIYPAGGVQSTAEDILKFGKAVLNNELVSRDSLEMMIDVRNSLAPQAGDDPYGLGWSSYVSAETGRIISHGGANPGVSAHFQVWLDKGIVSVAISNAFGTKRSAYELATQAGKLLTSSVSNQ